MVDSSSNAKKEAFEAELEDPYHTHGYVCTADDHKKNTNCDEKPLCLFNIGEKNLYDILGELDKVRDVATAMLRNYSKPIGLINAHNTCYINVLLQCLYRLWPFRKLLMSIQNADEKSVVYALQKIFSVMSLSKSLTYYPEEMIESMGVNPDIQCDVHEFLDTVFTTVKSILISQNNEDIPSQMDSLFTGKRLLCRCCLKCHRVFYQPDTFSFLDCCVVNTPRLEDALQELFTKEKLTGSEQYFCSSCKEKCDAEVLTKIKKLPPILMIRMQRLLFDRGSGNQMKLTNGVQIPLNLNFAEFSNLDSSVDVSDYVLVAVIHHHGDHATCGHYTCHVESDGKWYNVNDQEVDEIACPYVDVKEHPWRPFKQPNMMFSVEPSSYHDITVNCDDDDMDEDDKEKNTGDEIEAMPFKVVNHSSKTKKRRRRPIQRKRDKRSTRHNVNDDDDDDYECLPGGTSRSRRMVINNVTVQSAYMCFYMRRDYYNDMKEEEKEEGKNICSGILEKDKEAIQTDNKNLENSIQEEYQLLLKLHEDLANRIESINKYICNGTAIPADNRVFVNKHDYELWMNASDIIQTVVKRIDDKRGYTEPQPKEDNSQESVTEATAIMQSLMKNDNSDVFEIPIQEPISLIDRIMEILRSNIHKKDETEKEEDKDKDKDKDEEENDDIKCLCEHGHYDPIYFRTQFKGVTMDIANEIKKSVNPQLTIVLPADVECEYCKKQYTSFLTNITSSQALLTEISNDLIPYTNKRNKKPAPSIVAAMATSTGIPSKKERTAIAGHCLISSSFVNSLKVILRRRRRLLLHPERCSLSQYHYCSEKLDPTANLLCEHGLMKQYLRKMDWTIISDEIWTKLKKVYPSSVRVECDIEVCTVCKRKKTIKDPQRNPKDITKPHSTASSPSIPSSNHKTTELSQSSLQHPLSMKRSSYKEEDDMDWNESKSNSRKRIEKTRKNTTSTPSDSNSNEFHGFNLYTQILHNSFPLTSLYESTLSSEQHQQAILHSSSLASLVNRSSPVSLSYFSSQPQIKDGCYFLLSAEWLTKWRQWLQNKGHYDDVIQIPSLPLCQHHSNIIPGYMNHFIIGLSTIPCTTMSSTIQVELVNEDEMISLLHHHTLQRIPVGFYYGISDHNVRELIYYPGLCPQCQVNENSSYERQLKNEHKQFVVITNLENNITIAKERELILDKEKNIITTTMSPSCSIDEWKQEIASRLNLNITDIQLQTREGVIIDQNTIRSYGINPEIIVYIKYL